ncbi:saccharopine dehydrogenase [Streptomyces sp. NPDC005775]|uniref:saccharopine dehydrogenase n=1 Tax=unclassified Streptomyces TaxID=2593676 RepID=UPI0033D8AA25
MSAAHLWLRHETRATERRAPIVPPDARRLVEQGFRVTVEESPQRAFGLDGYTAAGCSTAPAGSWRDAPAEAYVVGLKELPPAPEELVHRHIFFGHAYKGQEGAGRLLRRFGAGGGALLDMEYLVDDGGRRLAAFGYWAGYVGAALALLHHRGALVPPLRPWTRPELDAALRAAGRGAPPRAIVLGALGRCGRGACDALETAGVRPQRWDLAETGNLDREALLAADLVVNAVQVDKPGTVFLTPADLDDPARRIRVLADVTCDVTSDCNVLPVYDAITGWDAPARRLRDGDHPVDVIAIDNLPSLLPGEASTSFSAALTPQLELLDTGSTAWERCLDLFRTAAEAHRKETSHD